MDISKQFSANFHYENNWDCENKQKIGKSKTENRTHQGDGEAEQDKHGVVLEVFATHGVSYDIHRFNTHIYRFAHVHRTLNAYTVCLGVRVCSHQQHQTLYWMNFIDTSLFFLILEPESFLANNTGYGVRMHALGGWKLSPKVAPREIFIHHCIITYHTWMLNVSLNFQFLVNGTTFLPERKNMSKNRDGKRSRIE